MLAHKLEERYTMWQSDWICSVQVGQQRVYTVLPPVYYQTCTLHKRAKVHNLLNKSMYFYFSVPLSVAMSSNRTPKMRYELEGLIGGGTWLQASPVSNEKLQWIKTSTLSWYKVTPQNGPLYKFALTQHPFPAATYLRIQHAFRFEKLSTWLTRSVPVKRRCFWS